LQPTDERIPTGSATYLLLNDTNRHQHNPKEQSLAKHDGRAFLSATWGPRGSGPNASCAMLVLATSARVSLHFASSFEMSWKETAVFSEKVHGFFSRHNFMQAPVPTASEDGGTPASGAKAKKRRLLAGDAVPSAEEGNSMMEYAHKCAMLGTLTTAWSPFVVAKDTRELTSLIAFAGRKACTVWAYPLPAFEANAMENGGNALLSSDPVGWMDTERYGWVTTSAWQQMHLDRAAPIEHLDLALGTSEGNILLCSVPVSTGVSRQTGSEPSALVALAPSRVVVTPHAQPVFQLSLGSLSTYSNSSTNDLVVASGSTISVWNVKKKRPQLSRKWKAHEGNITSLAIDYFGSSVLSSGVDGAIKVWDKGTGTTIMSNEEAKDGGDAIEPRGHGASSSSSRYPVFGLAISPSSAQITCVYVIPPAARPNRKSQADISYSRISSSLEYLPSPWMRHPEEFVVNICRILEERGSASSFTDVVWFCHRDNAALLALHESADGVLPTLLSKLATSVGDGSTRLPAIGPDAAKLSKKPVYFSLCSALEERHGDLRADDGANSPVLLQAAFLLLTSIDPIPVFASEHATMFERVRRKLLVYWSQRCLAELLRLRAKSETDSLATFLEGSEKDRVSALAMADLLSVQPAPLQPATKKLITTIYTDLASDDTRMKWEAFVQDANRALPSVEQGSTVKPPVPPAREMCFICQKPVPFGEFEQQCEANHAQDRCFLSFRVLSSMDSWKCMGCGALANEIDFSKGTAPFYLSCDAKPDAARGEATASSSAASMMCRLCGNYCSFFKY